MATIRMASFRHGLRTCGMAAALTLAGFGLSSGAQAQDAAEAEAAAPSSSASGCEADLGKLQSRRNAQIAELNALSKKGGKLDPVAACPKLRGLSSIEQQMVGYMVKNQNWCNIPEQIVDNVKQGSGKTAAIAKQACGLAAQMKKMQSQQAAGGAAGGGFAQTAPKLPAGPL